MKKYLLKIVLFFGIVAVLDFAFGRTCVWLQNHAKGGDMKSVRQTALIQQADIVVMGSSRARHHFVSNILADTIGMSAYNAGLDGNGIVLMQGLYAMISERYTPKVIIYDVEPAFDINVYPNDENCIRYIGSLRPYSSNDKVRELITRIDSMEKYKNVSAMFCYNSNFFELVKDQFVVGDYVEDGFIPFEGEMKKEIGKKTSGEVEQKDTLKLYILEEFIADICSTDTRLIMVASPKYGALSSEVFDPVKEICERYGVEFWDYYCTPEFQRLDYFKEPMHLNESGAIAFTNSIACRVKE